MYLCRWALTSFPNQTFLWYHDIAVREADVTSYGKLTGLRVCNYNFHVLFNLNAYKIQHFRASFTSYLTVMESYHKAMESRVFSKHTAVCGLSIRGTEAPWDHWSLRHRADCPVCLSTPHHTKCFPYELWNEYRVIADLIPQLPIWYMPVIVCRT